MKPDQISKTAAFLAIKFYGLTKKKQFSSLFDGEILSFYDHIVQKLPAPLNYYHYWLQFNWVRRWYIKSEELMLPGDLLHVVARKLYIRQLVDKLIDDGYKQLIVLGAGFDDLAFSYRQKGIIAAELDVPRMSEAKRNILNSIYPNANYPELIGVHISDNSSNAIFPSFSHINPNKKTVIIAEGFFDYLKTRTVQHILAEAETHFAITPALITTHFALDELPKRHQWVFKTGVQSVGEKLQLHKSIHDFKHLFFESNFALQQQLDFISLEKKLRKQTGSNLSMLKGFYILLFK